MDLMRINDRKVLTLNEENYQSSLRSKRENSTEMGLWFHTQSQHYTGSFPLWNRSMIIIQSEFLVPKSLNSIHFIIETYPFYWIHETKRDLTIWSFWNECFSFFETCVDNTPSSHGNRTIERSRESWRNLEWWLIIKPSRTTEQFAFLVFLKYCCIPF